MTNLSLRSLAPGVFRRQAVELGNPFPMPVFLLHEHGAAEGIGQHHIRSGLKVLARHLPHHHRMTCVELLGATTGLQSVLLQKCAGGAVGNQQLAFPETFQESGWSVGLVIDQYCQFPRSTWNIVYVAFYAYCSPGRNSIDPTLCIVIALCG